MSLARNGRLRTAPQMVPRGPVEIDWAHPLARGLLSYILLADGIGRDLVGVSGPLLRTGSALAQVGARGPGANFGNAANVALPAPGNPQVYTFEALIQLPPAAPGAAEAVCSYNSGSAGNAYDHDRSMLVGPAFAVSFYVYTGSAVTISGPSLSAGTVHHLVATSSGSELTLYADGVPVAATAAGGGFNYGSPPPFFCIGNGNDAASFNGVVHYAAQRNVALTAPEAAQLAAAPFAMLRPRWVPRRRGVIAAAQTPAVSRACAFAVT